MGRKCALARLCRRPGIAMPIGRGPACHLRELIGNELKDRFSPDDEFCGLYEIDANIASHEMVTVVCLVECEFVLGQSK